MTGEAAAHEAVPAGQDLPEAARRLKAAAVSLPPEPPAEARVLHSGPAEGAWNMALDEALAEESAATGVCHVRFYGWLQPTLSLGYFQTFESRRQHQPSQSCAVVRRASGGGAILHHRELTYSIAMPAQHPLARPAKALYLAVHHSLLEALEQAGILAELHSDAAKGSAGEPFLCFERRAAGDVVLEGRKIAGSAQRRLRGAILQHGSILLAASPFAPELPGVQEIRGLSVSPADLASLWQPILIRQLGLRVVAGDCPGDLVSAAKRLSAAKFGPERWTRLR